MPASPRETALAAIDVPALLKATGIAKRAVRHGVGARVFAQGAPANSVFYLQEGRVKLSVLSTSGKEAIVAILSAGDFFGEGCLSGQPVRMATATGRHHGAAHPQGRHAAAAP
jgi:CRP-like cAMP-binding protein